MSVAREAFEVLNRAAGIAPMRAPSFEGNDPILPTPFRAASAAAAALGLGAAAAGEIWRLRGGEQQQMSVDLNAAAASLLSFTLQTLDGNPLPREQHPVTGIYQCGDGRFIHLHGGFPWLAKRTLDLLNAEGTPDAIAAGTEKWNAFALEESLAFMELCGAVVRDPQEWKQTAQGAALAKTPPVVLKKIGSAPPLRLPQSADPLADIRVLDLTRVLAGPSAGRTLASYGADVLQVRSEKLPAIETFDLDTGHGKRAINLELLKPGDAETLRQLARNAHVFIDSYRPGALAKLGFSPLALAHSNPGMIYVAVSCYGHEGPWAKRRGWEQLAQAATGIAFEQGAFIAQREGRREIVPKLIPAAACDYISGYLAAAGTAAALLRRIREGGSWLVEVSLSATAMWLQSLGKADAAEVPESWNPAGLDAYMQSCETARGRLRFLGPVVRMAQTPPAWRRPPPMPGADETKWLAA